MLDFKNSADVWAWGISSSEECFHVLQHAHSALLLWGLSPNSKGVRWIVWFWPLLFVGLCRNYNIAVVTFFSECEVTTKNRCTVTGMTIFQCSITSKWATGVGVLSTCHMCVVYNIYFYDTIYCIINIQVYDAILCYIVLFNIRFIISVFFCRHFYHIILFYIPLYHESYSTMPYSTMSYSIMSYSVTSYSIVSYCIGLYCILLYCIIFYFILLYCTVVIFPYYILCNYLRYTIYFL